MCVCVYEHIQNRRTRNAHSDGIELNRTCVYQVQWTTIYRYAIIPAILTDVYIKSVFCTRRYLRLSLTKISTIPTNRIDLIADHNIILFFFILLLLFFLILFFWLNDNIYCFHDDFLRIRTNFYFAFKTSN